MTKINFLKKLTLQDLVTMGLLIAISLVLQRISFGSNLTKVGLGFIGTVLLGRFFGPVWGGIAAGIADLLSAAIFGIAGGFFPGFTLSAIVAGVIYGFFFYNQEVKIWRVIAAIIIVTLVVNVLMNTYWLTIMYGMDWRVLLMQRLLKEAVVPWIQMGITWLVLKFIERARIDINR